MIIQNKRQSTVVRVVNTSETFTIAALAAAHPTATVTKASIRKLVWSGPLVITVGGTIVLTVTGNGDWDLAAKGLATIPVAGDIVVNATGGFAIVEIGVSPGESSI